MENAMKLVISQWQGDIKDRVNWGRLHSRDVICVTLGGGVRICQEKWGDKEKRIPDRGNSMCKGTGKKAGYVKGPGRGQIMKGFAVPSVEEGSH